jgi:serine/threonine protein kinase
VSFFLTVLFEDDFNGVIGGGGGGGGGGGTMGGSNSSILSSSPSPPNGGLSPVRGKSPILSPHGSANKIGQLTPDSQQQQRVEGKEDPEETAGAMRWQLGEKIGSGAFGQVYEDVLMFLLSFFFLFLVFSLKRYKVLNAETGELFAMKQVKLTQEAGNRQVRKAVESLMQEIELMQELSHPNIVRYLGSERRGDTLNIFMEFVSGGSIASMLQKFSAFPEKVTASFTKQILEGLVYLHAKRIIHRDLKGGNILITPEGVVKLADFGASKKLQDIRTFANSNAPGTMTGTP